MAKNRDLTLPKTKLDQARERAQYDYDHAVSSAIQCARTDRTGLGGDSPPMRDGPGDHLPVHVRRAIHVTRCPG